VRSIPIALSDIKVAHSVFALPFAVLGAFLGAGSGGAIAWRSFGGQLALVVVCMVLARTWAMLVNRLADYTFDADNPRTARRVFASGRLSVRAGWGVALGCAAGFVGATTLFLVFFTNAWPVVLSVPVLGWIALYSYTKRFTWMCHLFLGSALALSPIAALIAVDPSHLAPVDATGGAVLLLASFVMLWVGGFDVAYALQDLDFDRERGLHSIPAKVGAARARAIAGGLHALGWGLLMSAIWVAPALGWATLVAGVAVGGVLIMEHVVLAKRGVAGLPMAFFTLNGVVSCLLGVVGVLDVIAI
jgi:4-hydroxybenzoate polyprenyltransferase